MKIRVKFWNEMTDEQKFLKLVYYVQLSAENRKRQALSKLVNK